MLDFRYVPTVRGGAMGAFSTLKSYLVFPVGLGPGVNTGQGTYPGTPMGVSSRKVSNKRRLSELKKVGENGPRSFGSIVCTGSS